MPDFVFLPGYELLTLDSVKSYIAKNGHLPQIPSAKELSKMQMGIGEMNMLLLRKVEELTLYLIQLKEENDRLISAMGKEYSHE